MRKNIFTLVALTSLLMIGCSEVVDTSARYVFKESTVITYLERHEEYSEYVDLLKRVPVSRLSTSTVYQLLTARGNYTCFAPTNDAIHAYLKQLVHEGLIADSTWEAFTDSVKLDSVRAVVVKNSIIDGGDMFSQQYYVAQFPTNKSEFALPNLNDRKLSLSWDENVPDDYFINDSCAIDRRNRDIPTLNGVVHQIHRVIAPKDITGASFIQEILEKETDGMLLFAKAVQACGLMDTLAVTRDDTYEALYQAGQIPDFENYQDKMGGDKSATSGDPHAYAPRHRYIGFTMFVESDEFWRTQGIEPRSSSALHDLVEWLVKNNMHCIDDVFTTDANYASPDNLLYQWVTYHILPMRIPAGKLVYHCNEVGYNAAAAPFRYSIPVFEWYSTLHKKRLLKIYESKESDGVYLNRFPNLNNGIKEDGHERSCDQDKRGCYVDIQSPLTITTMPNCCVYHIDSPLAYTEATRNNLSKERIRFDGMALFPEAMTNDIRRSNSPQGRNQHVYIPVDNVYQYFSNMSILSEDTKFVYFNGHNINWANYCQDEMKASGHYDVRFALPPVPRSGVYELRYKTLATSARGVCQIYFGPNPDNLPAAGIPIDMTKDIFKAFSEDGSWDDLKDEGKDEDQIIEIDHKLRNFGKMKAARHEVHEGDVAKTARDDSRQTRHIIVRQFLEADKTYYVRFKSCLESERKELYMDYMEWCPKEIYDNPEQPEDVW